MSNYNSQLQSNNIDLQTVLQTLQNKTTGSIPPLCKISLKGQLVYGDSPSFETFIYTTFENNKITAKILTYRDIFGEVTMDNNLNETREGEIIALQNSFLTIFSSHGYGPFQNIVDSSNLISISDYNLEGSWDFAIFQVEESPTAYLEFDM